MCYTSLSMTENRRAAIKKLRNLVITPKEDVDTYRARLDDMLGTVFIPNHVEKTEHTYGGVPCEILSPEITSIGKIILYIHGGFFVGGSCSSYRAFCASLANECSCKLLLPEFRLAPKYPFPASIDDVETVFNGLYEEVKISREYGKDAKIIIAADGSGASIACALLQRIPDEEKADISSLILFSPWLDVSKDAEIIASKKMHDEIISGENMHRATDLYTFAANYANPLVSPLCADSEVYRGFPPVYIQLGAKEILISQAVQFRQVLERAEVKCEIDSWPDMMYMFQMADEFLSSSHLALKKIGKFVKDNKQTESEEEKEEREKILRKNDIISPT